MSINRILFTFALLLFAACSDDSTPDSKSDVIESNTIKRDTNLQSVILESIKAKESQLLNSKDASIDITKAQAMISLYINYVNAYPTDTVQSPRYLLKAAEIAYNAKQGKSAITFLNRLIKEYPQNKKIATAYFLKGYVFDVVMQEKKQAELAYKEFIQKYPAHEMAPSAQGMLENLNLNEKQLIKKLNLGK